MFVEPAIESVMFQNTKDSLGLVALSVVALYCGGLTWELWPAPLAWVLALLTFAAGALPASIVIAFVLRSFSR